MQGFGFRVYGLGTRIGGIEGSSSAIRNIVACAISFYVSSHFVYLSRWLVKSEIPECLELRVLISNAQP